MGQLTLPPTGPIYLDANGFIYSVERIVPYEALLAPVWLAAGCTQFLTNDPGFRQIAELPVTLLSDVLAA